MDDGVMVFLRADLVLGAILSQAVITIMLRGEAALLLDERLPVQLEEVPRRSQAGESRMLGAAYFIRLLSLGEVYKHMIWSGSATFSSYDLGLKNGGRKHYDSEGRLTLEYFSKALGRMHHQLVLMERLRTVHTSDCIGLPKEEFEPQGRIV
jgi:hypothetical protein